MDGIAVDTSVVVAGLLSWHERHDDAFTYLQAALAPSKRFVMPLPVLLESYSVLTRLPPPLRVSPATARTLLHQTFRARAEVVALDATSGWGLIDDAVPRGIAGGSTYDAHVAACAVSAGVRELATFNRRHFERLDLAGVTLVVPGT